MAGVEVRDRTVTVHVRSRWGVPARHLFAEVTAAIAPLTADRPVRVVVADIDDPPGTTGAEPGTALGSAPLVAATTDMSGQHRVRTPDVVCAGHAGMANESGGERA